MPMFGTQGEADKVGTSRRPHPSTECLRFQVQNIGAVTCNACQQSVECSCSLGWAAPSAVKLGSNLTCVQASNIMRTTRGQWSGRVITLSPLLLLLLLLPLPVPAAAAAVRRVMARG